MTDEKPEAQRDCFAEGHIICQGLNHNRILGNLGNVLFLKTRFFKKLVLFLGI